MSAALQSVWPAETTADHSRVGVRAELSYLVPMTERAFRYADEVPAGEVATNMRDLVQSVWIEDARADRPPSLDREGFAFEQHESAVRNFFDADEVARVYDAEVDALLRMRTGAARVLIFDHTLRRRMPVEDDRQDGVRLPAMRVHVDYTEQSARRRVRDLLAGEADSLLRRRFAFINIWRPIGDTVRDVPLTLCDAQTVSSADLVPADLIYGERTGEIYYATYNRHHRWLYVSEMQPHEVILLKNYDSATDGRARLTPHAAFLDPTAPSWARPRQSIEVRAIAFFDD